VEGKITLKDNHLLIGPDGIIKGEIKARNVTISGEVKGSIFAADLVEIRSSGSVEGDIESARISVLDGAYFRGSVELREHEDSLERGRSRDAEPEEVSFQKPVLAEVRTMSAQSSQDAYLNAARSNSPGQSGNGFDR